jgi:hypothetical protein
MSTELERGDIFFFYRPRVGIEQVRSLADVQRFFFTLHPQDEERYRALIVGTKRLPDPDRHERAWAFVARVSDNPAEFWQELTRHTYETKTRGERVQPEARPAGEGRYAIVDHGGHSHIAYALELPYRVGTAQRTLQIESEASYIVAVRNPDTPAPPGVASPARRPALPEWLRERFGGRRFAPLDTPEWLDYEGVELVLIGVAPAAARELGIELDTEDERIHDADLFEQLRIRPGDLPVDPLRCGKLS